MDPASVPLLARAKRVLCACLPCGSITVGRYYVRVGPQFAEGGFSTVHRCTDRTTGASYALKRMIVSGDDEQARRVREEIRVHEAFQHPNLLRLLDYSETSESSSRVTFRLLFPYYESGTVGDVITRMRSVGKIFSEEHALRLFSQVLAGLGVMHGASPPFAHHDIKPDNVLLSGTNHAVLMDFGSCSRADHDTNDLRAANELKEWAAEHCTMAYRAPELFEPRNYASVSAASDVWSLGCTLFAMAFGLSPFEAQLDSSGEHLQYVDCSYLRVLNEPPFPQPAHFSKRFIRLIQHMLAGDPAGRPTVPQLTKAVAKMLGASATPSSLADGGGGRAPAADAL